MGISQVVHTKIAPPRRTGRLLVRPRVAQSLSEALHFRLTILQAGAGYGKSTALAAFAEEDCPFIWYQVTKEDKDPLVFLLHLCHATRLALPELGGLPIPQLESWEYSRGPLPSLEVVYQYLNSMSVGLSKPTLLVLDDAHLIADSVEIASILDKLIGLAPLDLHLLLATRPMLKLPNLSSWQARGEVLLLDQSLLAFSSDEIEQLFSRCYVYDLTSHEVEKLFEVTEGWAIALQMIWQSLRSGAAASIDDAVNHQPISLASLFEVLANEVLLKQPEDVQTFLRISATLRVMTPQACDAIRGASDSAALLSYLRRQELFVVDLGADTLRYQYIFHHFLRESTSDEKRRAWHSLAADYYDAQKDPELTVYHLLRAQDYTRAAQFLETYGQQLMARGRLNTLEHYLELLPPETFHQHPLLLAYQGDLARLHSRFREALSWYQQAESIWRERGQLVNLGRALRGQARVYLDTVNPSRAEELLQQALRQSDGIADREAQARLFELLAENKLNAGKPEEAESLRNQAEKLRLEGPADSQLMFRVLLRTGRLDQARRELEARVEQERREPIHVPRAHRETLFLLSLIYAFQGEAELAHQTAIEGTQRGINLDSAWVKAVGHMRQGHALMLLPEEGSYSQARQQFEEAIQISHTLEIPRLRVEACWGLCRAYGYQGDLKKALQTAEEGVRIAAQAGDEWIASLVRLAYGASLTLAASYESSTNWLGQAAHGFQECSDPFGSTTARLWLCFGWFQQNDQEQLSQVLPDVLATCHQQGYDFLFTRPSLLGTPDERMLVPFLIHAREQGWESAYVSRLLQTIGLPQIALHPGYKLRIYTLGGFQVWRGSQLVPAHGWRREKTRQLFQLLITYRQSPLDREQIFEHLWPGAYPETAGRNFKVVLNTLFNVLEPARTPGSDSAYILREGRVYGIRPEADVWIDAAVFSANLQQTDTLTDEQTEKVFDLLEEAITLYKGEYLPDARYEDWAAGEREHLVAQFLRASDRLCELYLANEQLVETIDLCQRILALDNCWERAYRHLMVAHHRLGDHGQIARTYQRCKQLLDQELGVSPSEETGSLYKELIVES